MEVYVVTASTDSDFTFCDVIGVYTTLERAKARIKQHVSCTDYEDTMYYISVQTVEED